MSYSTNWRDQLVYKTTEFLFAKVATPEYRAFVTLSSKMGTKVLLEELVQEIEEENA